MKTLRVLSYAINGRGMGHLVRQLAILRWMRRYAELLGVRLEPWVLSSSEADTLARREGIPCIKIPSKSMIRDAGLDPSSTLGVMRGWVLSAVATLQPDLMLVDTFPGGTFGELAGVLEIPRRRVLVARPVQDWIAQEAAFRSLLPLYDRVIVPEPPERVQHNPPFDRRESYVGPILIREREELQSREAARAALGLTGRAVYLSLGGGGDPQANRILPALVPQLRAAGWEVVVGAGPLYQGPELRGPGIVWLDRYVPVELFPAMDAAVSAGGYNSFHELMYCGIPTVFLPQPRLADDQAGRVQRA
ncbi:MAG TPA: UDP-glucosyltransferase, partial [Myxococcota bacterium]|nr:UDP-glucosyltransferase [Myxococcota bacterium]